MSQYQIGVITLTSINVIVAVGLYLTMLSGQLSAMHAALLGIGGYVAGYLSANHAISLWLSLVVGTLAAGTVAVAVACCLFRLNGFYLSIATLAVAQAMVTLADNLSSIGGADGLSGVPLRVGLKLPLVSALVVIAAVRYWERSLGGWASRALGEDEVAAQACGISLRRVRAWAFLVGGGLAGYAGALQAQNIGIVVPSSLGFQATVTLFFYVGIGGVASYSGAVVGAVVVSVLPEMLRFSTYDRYLYFGVALALMMVLRPYGLLPRVPLGHHLPVAPRTRSPRVWLRSFGRDAAKGTTIQPPPEGAQRASSERTT